MKFLVLRISKTTAVGFAVASLLLFNSCKTSEKKQTLPVEKPQPKPPSGYVPASVKQVTFVGESLQGTFSPDGTKVLYVSQGYPAHRHQQIYELSLDKQVSRRVTYHDGNASDPGYFPDGKKIFYASVTDEIKENPRFIKKKLARLNGQEATSENQLTPALPHKHLDLFEVYTSFIDGSAIRRITNRPQYDAAPDIHRNGRTIVFSSLRSGITQIYRMGIGGTQLKALTKGKLHNDDPTYSSHGKTLAWIRFGEDTKSSWLVLSGVNGEKQQEILKKQGHHLWHPSWHPDNEHIVFASNRDDADNFELYYAKTDGSCVQRLTYNNARDLHPAFSPDGKKILFASDRSGKFQLYIMDLLLPKTCPDA